jgi:hypothetical protein
MRNLYRRWSEFMAADSWADLATWRRNAKEPLGRNAAE